MVTASSGQVQLYPQRFHRSEVWGKSWSIKGRIKSWWNEQSWQRKELLPCFFLPAFFISRGLCNLVCLGQSNFTSILMGLSNLPFLWPHLTSKLCGHSICWIPDVLLKEKLLRECEALLFSWGEGSWPGPAVHGFSQRLHRGHAACCFPGHHSPSWPIAMCQECDTDSS